MLQFVETSENITNGILTSYEINDRKLEKSSRGSVAGSGDNGKKNQAAKYCGFLFQSMRGRQLKWKTVAVFERLMCIIGTHAYIFSLICYNFNHFFIEQEVTGTTEWLPATFSIVSVINLCRKISPVPPCESQQFVWLFVTEGKETSRSRYARS